MHVLNAAMFYNIYINVEVYFERKWQVHASAPKWRIPCRLLLGAKVIFNRISTVDVNISLEEQFRRNIEDWGNYKKLVKVKVGEERGGPWSDIDESETVQSCKDMQHIKQEKLCIQNLTRCFLLSTQYIYKQTTNTIANVCLTLVLWSEFTAEVIKKERKIWSTDPSFCQRLWTNIFFFLGLSSVPSIWRQKKYVIADVNNSLM